MLVGICFSSFDLGKKDPSKSASSFTKIELDVFIGSAQAAIIGKRILQGEVKALYQVARLCKK